MSEPEHSLCEFHLCDICNPSPPRREASSLDDLEQLATDADTNGCDVDLEPSELLRLISRARDAERYEAVLRHIDEANTDPRDADMWMTRWEEMAADALARKDPDHA